MWIQPFPPFQIMKIFCLWDFDMNTWSNCHSYLKQQPNCVYSRIVRLVFYTMTKWGSFKHYEDAIEVFYSLTVQVMYFCIKQKYALMGKARLMGIPLNLENLMETAAPPVTLLDRLLPHLNIIQKIFEKGSMKMAL